MPGGHALATADPLCWDLLTALLTSILLTSLAAYYQYGFGGFWRHDAFQQCVTMLILLLVGRLLGGLPIAPRRYCHLLGSVCMLTSMGVGLAYRLPDLVHDYRILPSTWAAHHMTFQSGLDRSSGRMQLTLPPDGRMVANHLPVGHYEASAGAVSALEWYPIAVMRYFGKSTLDVVPWSERQR